MFSFSLVWFGFGLVGMSYVVVVSLVFRFVVVFVVSLFLFVCARVRLLLVGGVWGVFVMVCVGASGLLV